MPSNYKKRKQSEQTANGWRFGKRQHNANTKKRKGWTNWTIERSRKYRYIFCFHLFLVVFFLIYTGVIFSFVFITAYKSFGFSERNVFVWTVATEHYYNKHKSSYSCLSVWPSFVVGVFVLFCFLSDGVWWNAQKIDILNETIGTTTEMTSKTKTTVTISHERRCFSTSLLELLAFTLAILQRLASTLLFFSLHHHLDIYLLYIWLLLLLFCPGSLLSLALLFVLDAFIVFPFVFPSFCYIFSSFLLFQFCHAFF